MGSELATVESKEVSTREFSRFSREQLELLKRTIAKGTTDDEFQLFVQTANRTGLDPFARQIYAVKRWDSKERKEVMQIQISIDGMRLTAQRSGQYAGQLGPWWCDEEGNWQAIWPKSKGYPVAARVAVLRHDFKEPLYVVAHWDEYVPLTNEGKPQFMWHKMPALMLGKVSESLALRKAFPAELSGLYSPEEMAQASAPEVAGDPSVVDAEVVDEQHTARAEPPATQRQLSALHTIGGKLGWTDEQIHEHAGVGSLNELSKARATELIDEWKGLLDGPGGEAKSNGQGSSESDNASPPQPSEGNPSTAILLATAEQEYGEFRITKPRAAETWLNGFLLRKKREQLAECDDAELKEFLGELRAAKKMREQGGE